MIVKRKFSSLTRRFLNEISSCPSPILLKARVWLEWTVHAHLNSPQLNPIVIIFLTKPCFLSRPHHRLCNERKRSPVRSGCCYNLHVCKLESYEFLAWGWPMYVQLRCARITQWVNAVYISQSQNSNPWQRRRRRFYLVLISFIIAEELHNNQIISFIFKTPSPWLLKKFRGISFCKFLCLCM